MEYNNTFVLVYKPLFWSSFAVIKWFKRQTGVKKVGHGGTLDPLAEGLLVLATGKKTKEIQTWVNKFKTYQALICLGGSTKSYDWEYPPTSFSSRNSQPAVKLELTTIQNLIKEKFTGQIWQQPPAFSARKIKGKRAYKLARNGQDVKLEPKLQEIRKFEILDFRPLPSFSPNIGLESSNPSKIFKPKILDNQAQAMTYCNLFNYQKLPITSSNLHNFYLLQADITVSKGTYIRSLANDLGTALGSGGFLLGLVRTEI